MVRLITLNLFQIIKISGNCTQHCWQCVCTGIPNVRTVSDVRRRLAASGRQPRRNVVYKRYQFWLQIQVLGENMSTFVTSQSLVLWRWSSWRISASWQNHAVISHSYWAVQINDYKSVSFNSQTWPNAYSAMKDKLKKLCVTGQLTLTFFVEGSGSHLHPRWADSACGSTGQYDVCLSDWQHFSEIFNLRSKADRLPNEIGN